MTKTDNRQRAVHTFLNSKGGVGKTQHAVYLTQALLALGQPVRAIDADATSATFSRFGALGVKRVALVEGDAINPRVFDDIVEEFLKTDANFVLDTGASAFVEVSRYLLKNAIPQHIVESGKRFVANIILTGGSSFTETALNLNTIAEQFPAPTEIIVWINDHFGPILVQGGNIEDLDVIGRHRARIAGFVRIRDHTFSEPATFGEDVKEMVARGLTFAEVRTSPDFTIMAKKRLSDLEKEIVRAIDPIVFS